MKRNNSWFTITMIDEFTYAFRELNHDEETNSYLLLGTEKALLIDSGMRVQNIFELVKEITSLPLLVAITHAHWDHIGGIDKLDSVLINKNEASWLQKFPITQEQVRNELAKTSFDFPIDFDLEEYCTPIQKNTKNIDDGDILVLGDRDIKCIFTPGHSPGHTCFYDEKNEYLFSGDLIYKGELDCYYDSTEPSVYRDSVLKLKNLPIKYIFGGHHDIFLSKDILDQTIDAFNKLHDKNELHHQGKLFTFKDISIRL